MNLRSLSSFIFLILAVAPSPLRAQESAATEPTVPFVQPPTTAVPFVQPPTTAVPFADGDRILFLGDSITQDGRYIAFIESYLWARYPNRNFTILNMGVSAETVSNTTEPGHPPRPWFHDRVDRALEIAKPDWVFICYGMNDGNYYPPRRDIQKAYISQYRRLLDRIEPTGAEVILLSPPPFDSASKPADKLLPSGESAYGYHKTYRNYDDTLVYLGALAHGTFGDEDYQIVDIHTPLQDYISGSRAIDSGYKYGDGVHPPIDGHLAWALAVLEALGEDRQDAYAVLHHLFGVALKTGPAQTTPADGHEALWTSVLHRFNRLSRVYRHSTRPETKGFQPNSAVFSEADQLEASLRGEIKKVSAANN